MYTNDQLNDPNLFSGPEFDADRRASYQRALAFYNAMKDQGKKRKVIVRKSKP